MEIHTIQAQPREKIGSKQVKELRNQGYVPATLYGAGIKEPLSLQVLAREFTILIENSEESSLIELQIGKKIYKTLLRNITKNPLKNEYLSIDFFAPNLKEVTEAEVTLHFVGTSESEKSGNMIIKNHTSLLVEALPTDLPEYLEVNLSLLKNVDDVIRVSDIVLPKGVSLVADSEETVVYSEEPRTGSEDDDMSAEELNALEAEQTKVEE